MSYWESDPLVYALNAKGELVHVDSVANGSACACSCPSCKQPLVAKNAGSMLVHHFARQRGACKWAVEAAVIRMVRDILEREGVMRVEGAGYCDACESRWYYFSPAGRLDVSQVSVLAVDGRQAPALVVSCVDEHGIDCEFVLVAELAHSVSAEQVERFREEGRSVLAIGLRNAYTSMRDAEGRHFSRREFLLRVQERAFLESALMGEEGSEELKWLVHTRRDAVESQADERYRKKARRSRGSACSSSSRGWSGSGSRPSLSG